MFLFGPCFSMKTTPRKSSICLDLKNQGKKSAKTRRMVFLETNAHRVGEKAENQRKTREKSKVAENQMFWLDFCAKKGQCIHPQDLTSLRLTQQKMYSSPGPEGVCTVLYFGTEFQPKHLVFYYLGFLPGFSLVFCFLPHPMHSPF